MIRSASMTRIAAPAAALLLSAGALAACGSSSNTATTTSTTSATTGASSSGLPTMPSLGGSGDSAEFCSGLSKVDLAGIANARDPQAVEQAWAALAEHAPAEIKPDLQAIAGYLHAAVTKDYTALQGAMGNLQTAVTHMATYVGSHCHG